MPQCICAPVDQCSQLGTLSYNVFYLSNRPDTDFQYLIFEVISLVLGTLEMVVDMLIVVDLLF